MSALATARAERRACDASAGFDVGEVGAIRLQYPGILVILIIFMSRGARAGDSIDGKILLFDNRKVPRDVSRRRRVRFRACDFTI